jgi:hypothetical protein
MSKDEPKLEAVLSSGLRAVDALNRFDIILAVATASGVGAEDPRGGTVEAGGEVVYWRVADSTLVVALASEVSKPEKSDDV